jgi:hypothetical protein
MRREDSLETCILGGRQPILGRAFVDGIGAKALETTASANMSGPAKVLQRAVQRVGFDTRARGMDTTVQPTAKQTTSRILSHSAHGVWETQTPSTQGKAAIQTTTSATTGRPVTHPHKSLSFSTEVSATTPKAVQRPTIPTNQR